MPPVQITHRIHEQLEGELIINPQQWVTNLIYLQRLSEISDPDQYTMKKDELINRKLQAKKMEGHGDHDAQPKLEDEQLKRELKIEQGAGDNEDEEDNVKWKYLEHHGVFFHEPYQFKNLPVTYDGKLIHLTEMEEELAWYWVQTLGTDREHDHYYRNNFAEAFMQRFKDQKLPYENFDKFDFSKVQEFRLTERENAQRKKKQMSAEQKKRIKEEKAEKQKPYIYSIVDNLVEKINNPLIEPPTLFKGRGNNSRAGRLKARVFPEDITVNLSEDAPIPKCPMPGHSWGEIVTRREAEWLCSYKVEGIYDKCEHKYISLAPNSKIKGENDRKKYEKARMLKENIERIRGDYQKRISSKDSTHRQLGVAIYLIDTLALRVGNEKGQDETDTVGCCSLRVEHIFCLPDNQIKLDFYGKDSMHYENTVTVTQEVWKAIHSFVAGKKPTQDLFDKIDAQALNDYLKNLIPGLGLTAKVFRTFNASTTLQNELSKANVENLSPQDKKEAYDQANKQVAILCNHQKTVSKKQLESLKTRQRYLQACEQYIKELEKYKNQFTAKKSTIIREDHVVEIEGTKKPLVKKFPETKEAVERQIEKTKARFIREKNAYEKKQENKEIAMGTSKTNYNDPRITVAWCKKNQVRIEKVFTSNLLSKFLWAMETEQDWKF